MVFRDAPQTLGACAVNPALAARALGGEVSRGAILCPGPNHSPADRSLSVRFSPSAPGGFVVHSFAGDDPIACKDYVRQRLALPFETGRDTAGHAPMSRYCPATPGEPSEAALRIWREARDPRETPVLAYLKRRGVSLPDGAAGDAVRYHPSCPFRRERTPAMIALVRDVVTNAPKAIHRTAIRLDGSPAIVAGEKRLSLGPVAGGAIKLTPDDAVTTCLGVGEGIESTLSLRELSAFGSSPVWSLLSAGNLGGLPPLPGVECLWIAEDHDAAGQAAGERLAATWGAAVCETFRVRARVTKTDLNDVVNGRAA